MTVRRVKARTERCELGPLRLFREDFEDMAEALAELGPLEIECDDYVGNAKEDFVDLPEKLTSLTISSQNDHRSIEVSLTARANTVTIAEANIHCRGILGQIQEICRRPGRRYTPVPILIITTIGLLVNVAFIFMFLIAVAAGVAFTILGVAGPLSLMAIILFNLRLGREFGVGVRLINAYRADRPSFWRRTRDDWAVESIVGLVFLVLGFVLGKVVG